MVVCKGRGIDRGLLLLKSSPCQNPKMSARRDARAVEWGGLENRYMGNHIGGSNPSPSANAHKFIVFPREC